LFIKNAYALFEEEENKGENTREDKTNHADNVTSCEEDFILEMEV